MPITHEDYCTGRSTHAQGPIARRPRNQPARTAEVLWRVLKQRRQTAICSPPSRAPRRASQVRRRICSGSGCSRVSSRWRTRSTGTGASVVIGRPRTARSAPDPRLSIVLARLARTSATAASASRPPSRRRQPTTVPVRPRPPRHATAHALPLRQARPEVVEGCRERAVIGGDLTVADRVPEEVDAVGGHDLANRLDVERLELVILDEQQERIDGVLLAQPADILLEVSTMEPEERPRPCRAGTSCRGGRASRPVRGLA